MSKFKEVKIQGNTIYSNYKHYFFCLVTMGMDKSNDYL